MIHGNASFTRMARGTWSIETSNTIGEGEMDKRISILIVVVFLIVALASCSQADLSADSRKTESTPVGRAHFNNGKSDNSYLDHVPPVTSNVDLLEVTNKPFKVFIRVTGHPAPTYWHAPRLSESEQPVVRINWFDAKTYRDWEGKRLPAGFDRKREYQIPTATQPSEQESGDLSNQTHQHQNTEAADSPFSGNVGTTADSLNHTSFSSSEWLEHWTELMDRRDTFKHLWTSRRADSLNSGEDEAMGNDQTNDLPLLSYEITFIR